MRAYRAHARVALQSVIAYRGAFLLSFAGSVFTLFALLYLFRAVYSGRATLAGYSYDEMKTYLTIGFVLNSFVGSWIEFRMMSRIFEGEVAIDLAKPIDYQGARFAEALGATVAEACSAIVVAAIVLTIFGGGVWPASLSAGLLFGLSFLLVIPLKFTIVYVTSLLGFWTGQFAGLWWTRQAVTNLFSGALIPLVFFPGWLQSIADALPFKGIVYTPAAIYLGQLGSIGNALGEIGIQAVWLVALWFGCRAVWRVAIRKLTVQGG